MERYLVEAIVDGGDTFDVLDWWKYNNSRFQILSNCSGCMSFACVTGRLEVKLIIFYLSPLV